MIDTERHIRYVELADGTSIYASGENPRCWHIANKQHDQWLCRDGKPRFHRDVVRHEEATGDDLARFTTLEEALDCFNQAKAAHEAKRDADIEAQHNEKTR